MAGHDRPRGPRPEGGPGGRSSDRYNDRSSNDRRDGYRDGGRGGYGPPRDGRDGGYRGGPGNRPGGRPGGRFDPRDRGPGPGGNRPPPRRPEGPTPDTVHRARDLVIAVKPEGMPMRGGPQAFTPLVNMHHAPRNARLRAVHQIDDVASGVVGYIPVTDVDDLNTVRSSTTYLAVVEGNFDTGEAAERVLTGPVPGLETKGSAAITSVRVVATGDNATLVRVRSRPDAPGQVRVHLASIGHAVLGDTQNGSLRDDVRRVALHAEEIRMRNPKTATTERFRSPAPASFYRAVGAEPPAGADDRASREAREQAAENAKDKGWDPVAGWYDDLIANRGSDHHQNTVLPGVERLLDAQPGAMVLDVACGQGVLLDRLAKHGDLAAVVGLDMSPELVERAQQSLGDRADVRVGDARNLGEQLEADTFDAVSCVLALMNIDDLGAVCAGASTVLKDGGRFVAVVLHPAFRSPQATAWGWTTDGRTGVPIQFRRVDRYMSERSSEIVMNPGEAAHGKQAITTTTYHRPIGAYVEAFAKAGLAIDAMEEWVSDRTSQAGPRANAENLSRAEIPMFLALRGVKR